MTWKMPFSIIRVRQRAATERMAYEKVQAMMANGYCRARKTARSLRAAGFPVEIVATPFRSRKRRPVFLRDLPWAPMWAVRLCLTLRGKNISSKCRMDVLKEAKALGKPGLLADAVLVANRLMR